MMNPKTRVCNCDASLCDPQRFHDAAALYSFIYFFVILTQAGYHPLWNLLRASGFLQGRFSALLKSKLRSHVVQKTQNNTNNLYSQLQHTTQKCKSPIFTTAWFTCFCFVRKCMSNTGTTLAPCDITKGTQTAPRSAATGCMLCLRPTHTLLASPLKGTTSLQVKQCSWIIPRGWFFFFAFFDN